MEKLASYMTKGKQISVLGHLDQDKWEKDGKQNSMIYIVADKIQLLGSGSSKGNDGEQPSESYQNNDYSGEETFPEDVPF